MNARRHDLIDILVIALCTFLFRDESCVDMADFGRAKEEFFRGFLRLENGISAHDTFSRVFRQLDPKPFRACFAASLDYLAVAPTPLAIEDALPTTKPTVGMAATAMSRWSSSPSPCWG